MIVVIVDIFPLLSDSKKSFHIENPFTSDILVVWLTLVAYCQPGYSSFLLSWLAQVLPAFSWLAQHVKSSKLPCAGWWGSMLAGYVPGVRRFSQGVWGKRSEQRMRKNEGKEKGERQKLEVLTQSPRDERKGNTDRNKASGSREEWTYCSWKKPKTKYCQKSPFYFIVHY